MTPLLLPRWPSGATTRRAASRSGLSGLGRSFRPVAGSLMTRIVAPSPRTSGRAAVRESRAGPSDRTREEIAAARRMTAAKRLSHLFAARLALMQDVHVYLVPARLALSFRRADPKPALNGKVYVPPLPAGAVHLGRYTYPHSRRAFLRDLMEAIR